MWEGWGEEFTSSPLPLPSCVLLPITICLEPLAPVACATLWVISPSSCEKSRHCPMLTHSSGTRPQKSPDTVPSAPEHLACPACSLENTFAKNEGGWCWGSPPTTCSQCQGHTTQRVPPQAGEAAAGARQQAWLTACWKWYVKNSIVCLHGIYRHHQSHRS